MYNICVIGTGYVGLVSGACLAELGNHVTCLDIVPQKIASLQAGVIPLHEPGLDQLIRSNVQAGRLHFTTSYTQALSGGSDWVDSAEFIFIAVNTPPAADGRSADITYVISAAQSIGEHLDHPAIIINKSTVPVGTCKHVSEILGSRLREKGLPCNVVMNPEFLREGSAIEDFMHPDRVVIGSANHVAAEQVAKLYAPLRAPTLITDLSTAEMIKYAANGLLATKISFINEISQICEILDADVKQVAEGIGYDHRLGHSFLEAGIGYGGSCFPKDVAALSHMAEYAGVRPRLLNAVMEVNRDQQMHVIRKLETVLGELKSTTIGILGLAFKPNTDDMREAPSLGIIRSLIAQGAQVRAYDPVAVRTAQQALAGAPVAFCKDAYHTAEGCDALVLVTEWDEFRTLDMSHIKDSMHRPVLIDGRNMFAPEPLIKLGFVYQGIGRYGHPPALALPEAGRALGYQDWIDGPPV